MQKRFILLLGFLIVLVFIISGCTKNLGTGDVVYGAANKKVNTGLKSGVTNQLVSGSSGPRCIVKMFPQTYTSLTGDTFCASNDARECVAVVDYLDQSKDYGIIDISDSMTLIVACTKIHSRDGVSTVQVSNLVSRRAICCRFD